MKKATFRFILTIAVLIFGNTVCYSEDRVELNKHKSEPVTNQKGESMNSYVSIFEIPATDISRAIEFYEAILDVKIEKVEMPGMEMGVLPYEEQAVIGVIVKGEGSVPSASGVTIYLNGGDDLQGILDRVKVSGGKVVIPKSPHADDSGYFAIFHDSEGNRLGLHSPN